MTSYPNSGDDLRRDEDYPLDSDPMRDPGDRTLGEKAKDAADELAGKVKQGWGDMTDDERLQAEGRRQEADADARQAADRAADHRDDPLR